jgi:hypothetical protein
LTTSPSIPSIHAAAAVTQLTSGSLILGQNVHLVAAAAYVVAVLELQRTDANGLAPFMDGRGHIWDASHKKQTEMFCRKSNISNLCVKYKI